VVKDQSRTGSGFFHEGEYVFTVDSNSSSATIRAYAGTDREISIPSMLGGHQVDSIGENSFSSDHSSLLFLVIVCISLLLILAMLIIKNST
jgi:hypothetical protein